MGHNGTEEIYMGDEGEGSESTIEIKIKTLDSQTYSLRVDKQIPVSDFKEKIAAVSGISSEQQRLICSGKVLKNDQLLSAYHVEDGHALHLVLREPPVINCVTNREASFPPESSTSVHQGTQVDPNLVIQTFNMLDHADGVPADISRIVSYVISSFGSIASGSEGVDFRELGPQRLERMVGLSHTSRGTFGLPAAFPLGSVHHNGIPDSLAPLSQHPNHSSDELDAIGRDGGSDAQAARTEDGESRSAQLSGTVQGLPTPDSLGEVLQYAREMLMDQAAECLHELFRQIVNQVGVVDPSVRSSQSVIWRTGSLIYNLGAYLLELGRATMTSRLGQTSSGGVMTAGPAVFNPNPLVVQPLPLQPGTSRGAVPIGTMQPTSSLVNRIGHPRRRSDTEIQRGSSISIPNANQEETGDAQHPSELGNQTTNSGEPHPIGTQTEQEPLPEPRALQDYIGNPPRDGSLPPSGPEEEFRPRTFNISILSARVIHSSEESETEIPSNIMHLLRTLFPGSEIHVEAISHEADSVTQQTETSRATVYSPEVEPSPTDEGILLSNMLRQIMPTICQLAGTESNVVPVEEANVAAAAQDSSTVAENSDIGTSGPQTKLKPFSPDTKRQKME